MSTKETLEHRTALLDNYIAQIGGLVLTIGGVEQPAQFPDSEGWQAVEGIEGLYMRPLLVPGRAQSDYMHTKGEMGTYAENVEMPQSFRFTVIEGSVLWRQQWANGGEHQLLEAGHTAYVQPHEKHGYTFLADCFNVVVITPPLSHLTPPAL